MELKTYQAAALKTAKPTALNLDYLIPGLVAEVGECFGKVAKAVRDEWDEGQLNVELVKEWGDVAWFVAVALHLSGEHDEPAKMHFENDRVGLMGYILAMNTPARTANNGADRVKGLKNSWRVLRDCSEVVTGQPFDVVLEANLAKLADRQARNVIGGSGDAR